MAFIGNVPAESYITTVKDTFSGNASDTDFTLSQPSTTNDVRVVVENVVQEPTTAYSVTGTTLTFTSAPPSGSNNVYVIHLGPAVQTTVPPETFGVGSIYGASDTDTAITFEGSGVTTFDQNGTEAARIDANGNFLVGKTSASLATEGFEARADQVYVTRDGNTPLYLNRLTSDGNILQFRKDTSVVGSIGVISDDQLYIIADSADGFRIDADSDYIAPCEGDGTNNDATLDLGTTNSRFKDLYLSGGVVFGDAGGSGTSSSNTFDSYEEGTFTPSAEFSSTNPTAGATTGHGRYVKTGNLVNVTLNLGNINVSGASGDLYITGLPFTSNNDGNIPIYIGTVRLRSYSINADYLIAQIGDSDSYVTLFENDGTTFGDIINTGNLSDGNTDINLTITYPTN